MTENPVAPIASAQPLISVIMPCYNAASFLEEAVNCVMSQTYPNVEVIVVDDASTDGGVAILEALAERYGTRMKVLFQHHLGPFPARNQGLREATGSLIAFLDADDYWAADCLEKLASALQANDADIAYCGWQNVGEGGPGSAPHIPPDYSKLDITTEFLRSCPWPIHAALVRRTAIDAVNGFSERRFSAMDYDLWLRLHAHTQKLVRVPEVLAFYRWHDGGQISKTRWKQVLDATAVREEFAANHPERMAHIPKAKRVDLIAGTVLKEAYRAYWKRQLTDAQKLFRHAFLKGNCKAKDLKFLLASMLPAKAFQFLVRTIDRKGTQ